MLVSLKGATNYEKKLKIKTERIGKIPCIKISKNNLHMNDTNIDTHKNIFGTLQEMNTS
jgi:hypothetical protein